MCTFLLNNVFINMCVGKTLNNVPAMQIQSFKNYPQNMTLFELFFVLFLYYDMRYRA